MSPRQQYHLATTLHSSLLLPPLLIDGEERKRDARVKF
jgi:hypothetical protein